MSDKKHKELEGLIAWSEWIMKQMDEFSAKYIYEGGRTILRESVDYLREQQENQEERVEQQDRIHNRPRWKAYFLDKRIKKSDEQLCSECGNYDAKLKNKDDKNIKKEKLGLMLRGPFQNVGTVIELEIAYELRELLREQGISLDQIDENSYDYKLTLPVTLSELNHQLNLPKDEWFENGEQFYLPPIPIIDILDEESLNSSISMIEEKDDSIIIKSDHYGHLFGFLKYYVNNLCRE